MQKIRCCLCVGFFAMVAAAQAAPVVNLGQYYVRASGSHAFALAVTDAGNAASQDIQGMTFTLQIGAGTGSAPAIGAVDFLTSSVWTNHVSPANVIPSLGAAEPQFKSFTLITDAAGDFINANGTLATVAFQGGNATPGNYAVKLTGTKDLGSDSQFTSGLGATVPATFSAGTLTVVSLGDFDRNGETTVADIREMLRALTDLDTYKTNKSLNDNGLLAIGDLNNSGAVTNADLQGLLNLLATSGGGSAIQGVPEPTAVLLALFGVAQLAIVRHRRRVISARNARSPAQSFKQGG